jgi:hypothetical protein
VDATAWSEFKADLRASADAWRAAPLLPLISIGLASAVHIPEPWWWLALPALLFSLGWPGSERIWYLRIFRGEAMSLRELWRLTGAFVWRFVRLALVAAVALVPVLITELPSWLDDPENAEDVLARTPAWIAMAFGMIVVYFALTFVTPALSFSTKRVRTALRLGFGMLRGHWPRTAWYAVVPPLTVVAIFRLSETSTFALPGRIAVSAAATLLNVWFKGATAAFYLRREEVASEGSAFIEDERVSEGATA